MGNNGDSTDDDEDARDGPGSTVPVGFAHHVRRPSRALEPFSFDHLRQRVVDVHAHGFVYRGTLLGVGDETVYLRMEHKSIELPLAEVTRVVADGYAIDAQTPADDGAQEADDER